MPGDLAEARRLRNLVNRAAPQLRQQFYQSKIDSMEESSTRDWWKHIKRLMGTSCEGNIEMQGLTNKHTEGDMGSLVNSTNEFFVSVSEDLPILQASHSIVDVSDPLPVQYTISVNITEATGPDKIPPWIVRDFAQQLAGPVTSIFNSSLREDVLPKLWTTATVIPLPKKRPPESIENDIRPIVLTPILAKVVESIVGLLKLVDNIIITQIDDKQFGGMAGTGTTDALVEMLHKWYETTDEPGTTVRVLFLDYRKAFDLIYHETLINKLVAMNLPAHIVRWMAAFLLDHEQTVKHW